MQICFNIYDISKRNRIYKSDLFELEKDPCFSIISSDILKIFGIIRTKTSDDYKEHKRCLII